MLVSLNSESISGLNVRMVNTWHLFNTTNSWFVLLNKLFCYGLGHNVKKPLKMWGFIFLGIIPLVFTLSVYPEMKFFFVSVKKVTNAFDFYSWL